MTPLFVHRRRHCASRLALRHFQLVLGASAERRAGAAFARWLAATRAAAHGEAAVSAEFESQGKMTAPS